MAKIVKRGESRVYNGLGERGRLRPDGKQGGITGSGREQRGTRGEEQLESGNAMS